MRDQARRDPASLLARAEELVLNEVQRTPDLLLAVKQEVDGDRRGLLLHAGDDTFRPAEGILATPWWRVI